VTGPTPRRDCDIAVLFVDRDDVCRAPVARALSQEEALRRRLRRFLFDSAGTSWRHAGDPTDPIVMAEARARGHEVGHVARRLHTDDFGTYDLLIVMDAATMTDLERVRGGIELRTTPHLLLEPQQVQLLRRWDPFGMPGDEDLARPLASDASAIRDMFDIVERCTGPLLDRITELASFAR
jgi:protein-tyrosine-phosphatase